MSRLSVFFEEISVSVYNDLSFLSYLLAYLCKCLAKLGYPLNIFALPEKMCWT